MRTGGQDSRYSHDYSEVYILSFFSAHRVLNCLDCPVGLFGSAESEWFGSILPYTDELASKCEYKKHLKVATTAITIQRKMEYIFRGLVGS